MSAIDDRVGRIQDAWRRERPDLDVSPLGIVGRLHRLADALTEELLPVYRAHGLGEGDFDVLATLRRGGPPFECSAGGLAASTMVTTGGLTKRVDRLEGAGLVIRRASADDGRGRLIALTEAGRTVIDSAFSDHVANEHRLLEGMPPADRAVLERLLAEWLVRVAHG
jgi:DNA-binding MarR family transcriptional regulator